MKEVSMALMDLNIPACGLAITVDISIGATTAALKAH